MKIRIQTLLLVVCILSACTGKDGFDDLEIYYSNGPKSALVDRNIVNRAWDAICSSGLGRCEDKKRYVAYAEITPDSCAILIQLPFGTHAPDGVLSEGIAYCDKHGNLSVKGAPKLAPNSLP